MRDNNYEHIEMCVHVALNPTMSVLCVNGGCL